MSNKKLVLVAAAALIDADNRVLLQRRPQGKSMAGLWEFPGGKIELHETPEQGLVRELKEELAIQVAADNLTPLAFASHAYEDFHLLMPLFSCRTWSGEMRSLEGQSTVWVGLNEVSGYEMPPADRPLVKALLRDFHR